MGIKDLNKKVDTLLGIDVSTNSFAFCVFQNGEPVQWGEIHFKGKNVFERVFDIGNKLKQIMNEVEYEAIYIEPIVYVNNRSTVISMGYAMGAVLSSLKNRPVYETIPLQWQKFIGNPPLTKIEVQEIKKAFPEKSDSWYKEHGRSMRKERTKLWVRQTYGIVLDSDNVADAFGVAYMGWSKHGKNSAG